MEQYSALQTALLCLTGLGALLLLLCLLDYAFYRTGRVSVLRRVLPCFKAEKDPKQGRSEGEVLLAEAGQPLPKAGQ